jgi:hypothetical protein
MPRKKQFTMERYNKIKQFLEFAEIHPWELDDYVQLKRLRYERYKEETGGLTDEQMLAVVNEKHQKGEKDDKQEQ